MPFLSRFKPAYPCQNTPIVLELDLSRGIQSAPPENPLEALRSLNAPSLAAIREGLQKGAKDQRVKGLVIHIGALPLSLAQSDELAEEIREFGRSKPTIAFTESFGEFGSAVSAYKLAASAHQIWVQPSGMLTAGGIHLDITLLKGLLTKLGIEPQFGQRQEYKTAADRFAASEVTHANREMMTRLGQSLMDESVASIARDRGLSTEKVWEAVDNSPLTPQQSVDAGLIDRIGYRDEVFDDLHTTWGTRAESQLFVHRYAIGRRIQGALARHQAKDTVSLITIRGNIVLGRGNRGRFMMRSSGSDEICEQLRAVARNDQVKAVVLNVDSPGGSYIASDTIRRAVLQLRKSGRPVVVSMGDVAASGGYFVSMAADEIVALPSTLTGSIGVLAGKMVTAGLYEKLELKREGIDIGKNAGILDPGKKFTEAEWQILNADLDRIYADFTEKAAKDRGLELAELEASARGRVWTGADARAHRLVDHLGGLQTAFLRACSLAGLDPVRTQLKLAEETRLFSQFIPARNSESPTGAARIGVPTSADDLVAIAAELAGVRMAGVLSLPLNPRISG